MNVFVARHGETTWNVAGRYQGRRESTLSALGERQARALVAPMRAHGVGRVLSSPLVRCIATARPTADALGYAIETDERLIEIAHGSWEDRLREEIAANDPQRYFAWRHDPGSVAFDGGETLVAVRDRWCDFARDFTAVVPTLIVTHDAVLRVALLAARGADWSAFWSSNVENGAFAVFDVADGVWTLVNECSNGHLAGARAAIDAQAL